MTTADNQIEDITFFVSPDGDLYPDKDLPINDRKLEGFVWREEERPKTIMDLFSEDDNQFKPTELRNIPTPDTFLKKIKD